MQHFRNNLEKTYNPRESVKNYNYFLNISKKKSKNISIKLQKKLNLAYGIGKLQKLDVFYKKRTTLMPIHVFIHGGYWRALDKSYHNHMAEAYVNNNLVFFNVNYDLCPNVNLSKIKEQIIEAVIWIYRNSIKFNGNNKNIVISGHSAGAHLVSLMLNVNWRKYNLPFNIFKGAALVSGIYNTKIVLMLNINKKIKLSFKEAMKNNTLNVIPMLKIPVLLACGKQEPLGWKEQTVEYYKMLKNNNFKTKLLKNLNENHFSLIDAMSEKKNTLFKTMLQLSR